MPGMPGPAGPYVWEELFGLTRGEIETGHETESEWSKRDKKEQSEEDEEKKPRVGIKLATYLEYLLVSSLFLQLEVAVQSHYGDTA